MEERDNINALRLVKQELSDAVAIAEKAAAGKAISGGLVKEGDQLNFVVVVLSDDHVKEVFLEPPRATSKRQPAGAPQELKRGFAIAHVRMVEGLTIRSNDKCRSASGRMPTLLFDQMAALRQKRPFPRGTRLTLTFRS